MSKKILALCLVVVLAVTAVTGATLAYFTDESDKVTNTFTVGDVQIKLDEAPVDPETGKEIAGNRRTENEYKDIYPGQVLDKDPMVTIEGGSEPSYVRMFVTANVEELEAAFPDFMDGDIFDLENLVDWDKAIWPCVDVVDNGDGTATYEFRYHTITTEKAADQTLEPLFTEVTIPDFATSDDLKALVGADGKFSFTIIAQAIQAAGFEADAENEKTAEDVAWEAYDEQDVPENSETIPVITGPTNEGVLK